MKKHYERPVLMVERFELTQRLSNCAVMIGLNDRACVMQDEDSNIIMKNLAAMGYFAGEFCISSPEGMDFDDGMCYHISINTVFSS